MASPDDVEQQFYDALRDADLERLMAVWALDDDIVCVHPGGLRLSGLTAVRESFDALCRQGGVPVQPQDVRRFNGLGTAVHSVLERIDLATAEGLRVGWVLATNVYLKTPQGWKMVAHHASPADGTPPEPMERRPDGPLH